MVSLDGSTLDIVDEDANVRRFGRSSAGRGGAALFSRCGSYRWSRTGRMCCLGRTSGVWTRASSRWPRRCCPRCAPGCSVWLTGISMAFACGPGTSDRGGAALADLTDAPPSRRLPDGSYLSRVYASPTDHRRGRDGLVVRVIEYRLEGVPDAEPRYRLLTTILGSDTAPALELAALYHERWEIETALDELKTHLREARIVLRSKSLFIIFSAATQEMRGRSY